MTALKTEFLKFRDNETGVEQLYEVIPPAPTETDRGGIIAAVKTENETVEAKLGDDGKLYVPEGTKDYNELENVPTKLSQFENDLEIVNSWNDLEDKPFYEDDTELKQLDEKFIPDTIARTSYVDENFALKSDLENIDFSNLETKTDATAKLAEAKQYTDEAVANIVASDPSDTKINAHNTATDSHTDIRTLISDLNIKVTNFLDVDDITTDQLSEVIALINNNKGTLESLTTSKVNVTDIIDNLNTALTDKVLSANQGVVIKGLIDDLEGTVNTLQTDVNAQKNHNHDDVYDEKGSAATAETNANTYTDTALSNKADAEHNHDNIYYTQDQIDEMEFITVDDIDEICGTTIQMASEVAL